MTGPPRRSRLRTRTAVVCSVADQGVTALTNIAVLVVAARLSTAADFAVFTMVYMSATVGLGLSGAYLGQALVLERGEALPGACRSTASFAGLAATAVGLPCAVLLAFVPGQTAQAFAALALVLPIVLTQDTLRYCFSALRLPQLALCADLLRLSAVLPLLMLLPSGTSPARLVTLWGVAALPALVTAALLLAPRTRGGVTEPRRYLRRGHLGRRFVVEFGVGNGTSQFAVIALGLLADPLAVGALRGAATLFGPMNVLCNSATAFGPPLLGRVPGLRGKARAGAVLAGALALASAGWAAGFLALPDAAGRQVLGDTWSTAAALLPATGSQYLAIAAATSALLTLRVLRPRDTLPIQLAFSLTAVGLLCAGYALGGISGAAWGLCAGSALKAAALWARVGHLARRGTTDGINGTDRTDSRDRTVHKGGEDHDPSDAAGVHRGGV